MESLKFWIALAIWSVVLLVIALCNWSYLIDKDEQLRNLGFLAAALMGAPLVIWRTMVLQRDVIARENDVKLNNINALSASYIQAMEHLGAMDPTGEPKVEIRIGAIYALEKIAIDNPGYRLQVIRVLEAYVNEQTRIPPEDGLTTYQENYNFHPRSDVEAVFEILSQNSTRWISERLDVNGYYVSFKKCHLNGLIFISRQLRCSFVECHLVAATLNHSIFEPNSLFYGCHLSMAQFQNTTARGCYWAKSKFIDDARSLHSANFDKADIRGSEGLTPEQLETVDLRTTKRDSHQACGQPFPYINDDRY